MILIIIIALLNFNALFAGVVPNVGSGFSYQGELIFNNTVTNGLYDFSFRLFSDPSATNPTSSSEEHLNVMVNNGIFTIDNLDFGDQSFTGQELWLLIRVKTAGSATYVKLSPLQRINASPYAIQAEFVAANAIGSIEIKNSSITSSDLASSSVTSSKISNGTIATVDLSDGVVTTAKLEDKAVTLSKLSPVGVSNGDVIQFNGIDWVTTALSNSSSPWTVVGSDINYEIGQVSIGTTFKGAKLLVQSPSNGDYVFRARVDNNTKFLVDVNGGTTIGGFSVAPDNGLKVTGDTELNGLNVTGGATLNSINVTSGSSLNVLTVTGGSALNGVNVTNGATLDTLSVTGDSYLVGKVGINVTNPSAKFEIRSDGANENPLVVKTGTSQKFVVNDNGGTSIGSSSTPPANGLKVSGNVKQSLASNGLMKYMVNVFCDGTNTQLINSYDGVSPENIVDPITVSNGIGAANCSIKFPSDIDNRYYQVSHARTGNYLVNCGVSGGDTLVCSTYNLSTMSIQPTFIMVLVY